jgi:uncharacterized membrane protein YgcG
MAIFNPNRKQGGTIELVRDAQGNYTTQEVGFNTLASLSIPDFKTTTTPTTTTTDTKTATDITGDTTAIQTQMAFQMPERGDNNVIDTTGSMLQEARKTSSMLSDTFTRPNMRDVAGDKITSSLDIQSPTERVFDRPNMRDVAGDRRMTAKEAAPQENILSDVSLKDPAVTSANVQRGVVEAPGIDFDFLKGDRFKQGTTVNRPNVDRMAADAMTRQEMVSGATPDDATANTLGITVAKSPETALDTQRFKGSTAGTLSDPAEKQDVKPEVKPSALETISTSLRTTKDSILNKIKTPMMMALDVIATPRNETEAAVDFNKRYFNVREDGRIAGNPSTDLFAGMNRVSAFGNLNQAGAKRIARREKTIATKNVSDKFKRDTEKMKEQHRDYLENKAKDRDRRSGGNTTTNVTGFGKSGFGRDTDYMGQGGGSSGGGGKIVCTMMNESYGFGSFRNKIWMKFHGNIAPEYQKGYHKLFLPLVNYAKQKGITNKIIKNVLEHIAVHSTIDMRQTLRGKRHTLGRLYRKVILPLCYWVGKI